jgi:hypothetical protein
MSMFNPDTFLNTSYEEEFSTARIPVPEGEYTAVIREIKPRTAGANKERAVLDVIYGIDDPSVAEVTGFESPQVRQSIFLDLSPTGSLALGPGKNVQLGKLREACGQNQKGKPWQPGMLVGQVVKVKVAHRTFEDEIQADVKAVTALD